jgi:hypothetical protein
VVEASKSEPHWANVKNHAAMQMNFLVHGLQISFF